MSKQLIEQFYTAFQAADAEAMCACYHADVVFEDPAFGVLRGKDACDMWRMLMERSKGQVRVSFGQVEANAQEGSASWEAVYPFSDTGRLVHNKVSASFQFKDGKIVKHTDVFSLWKWAGMALGLTGWAMGWAPIMQNKIRNTAQRSLKKFQEKRAK
jgi:ketosteroid isomerase-like protein